jgi:plasmid replication initiation protein
MKIIKDKKGLAFSNSLVSSKYHLTREEQNLVFLVATQINKEDKDFKTYKVSVADLEQATGVIHNRKRIKELSLSIMSKPIVLPDNNVVNWFSSIKPLENESALLVRFDKDLKPYLLQLDTFTKADKELLFSFKSKYSSRLYMLLKSVYGNQEKYKLINYVVYEINDLITRFKMPKSYAQRYSLFKNDFLNKSLIEINEKTDFYITYDDKSSHRKTGRKITSIEFCITKKEKTQEELKKEIENTKTLSDYIPKNLSSKATSILLDSELGLKNHDLKHIFDHYKVADIENICEDLWKCWDSPKIISKQGLFRGKIKQLNKKKTENLSFFDEV